MTETPDKVQKILTGMKGFDQITHGGLPEGRSLLVIGTCGSGKTIFGATFLARGIEEFDDSTLFVTFEVTPEDLRADLAGMGWPIRKWEEEGKWNFLDGTPTLEETRQSYGDFDLEGLLVRLEHSIQNHSVRRVVFDSLSTLENQFDNKKLIRREFLRITSFLKKLKVTSLLLMEKDHVNSIVPSHVEEFATPGLVLLKHNLEGNRRLRSLEIVKMRGTNYHSGEFPSAIQKNKGFRLFPLSFAKGKDRLTQERLTTGISALDEMCNGGLLNQSMLLISGATGTGKTLLATKFAEGGALEGEKSLFITFEESREQIFRNTKAWGMDLRNLEDEGKLQILSLDPEKQSLTETFLDLQEKIEEFQPQRVILDSLTALKRTSTEETFTQNLVATIAFLRQQEVTALFTYAVTNPLGHTEMYRSHLSTLTDAIFILRYVEVYGEMRRGIVILKMRGSQHDKMVREIIIDKEGFQIGKPFRSVSGILGGGAISVSNQEVKRLQDLSEGDSDFSSNKK